MNSSMNNNNNPSNHLFDQNRRESLNLLNHSLQLQLVTGDLQFGAFQRLILDRKAILEGLEIATRGTSITLDIQKQLSSHDEVAADWIQTAEKAGKTITVSDPNIKCYNCGGTHLNIDCPEDQAISSSAQALKSLLISNGVEGATAVLQCYSFCCSTLLKSCGRQQQERQQSQSTLEIDPVYHGWLETHATTWARFGEICGDHLANNQNGKKLNTDGYTVCLSMLYNWIDAEAATTGIRADLNDPTLSSIMDELERLEPGYASQRDKHQSFVADLTGTKTAKVMELKAQSKVDKAAAYLAAKNGNSKTKNAKLDAAAAYLAAKKKKEGTQ